LNSRPLWIKLARPWLKRKIQTKGLGAWLKCKGAYLPLKKHYFGGTFLKSVKIYCVPSTSLMPCSM
jgi:hypothetical protein